MKVYSYTCFACLPHVIAHGDWLSAKKIHESWCNRKNNWSPGTLKLTREKFRELGLHEKLHFANRKVDQQKGTFKGWVEVWLIAVDLCLCILKNHRKHKETSEMETVDGGQQVDHVFHVFVPKKSMLKCHEDQYRDHFLAKHYWQRGKWLRMGERVLFSKKACDCVNFLRIR